MDGPPNRKARPDVAASGAGNIPRQRAELTPSRERDQRLLSLDFLGEVGDSFVTLGAALCAAASAENLVVIEMALRQMRATIVEGIAVYKAISADNAEGAS
ncbi:hypothetical protein [Methylocystis sp.]|uniref:hypothetical protein n=1 Tax=Methylocystis sp. TaxID=1911079 RepID=UPI0025EAA82D|nr:hypothetical protein [Methylocystis sp.]